MCLSWGLHVSDRKFEQFGQSEYFHAKTYLTHRRLLAFFKIIGASAILYFVRLLEVEEEDININIMTPQMAWWWWLLVCTKLPSPMTGIHTRAHSCTHARVFKIRFFFVFLELLPASRMRRPSGRVLRVLGEFKLRPWKSKPNSKFKTKPKQTAKGGSQGQSKKRKLCVLGAASCNRKKTAAACFKGPSTPKPN